MEALLQFIVLVALYVREIIPPEMKVAIGRRVVLSHHLLRDAPRPGALPCPCPARAKEITCKEQSQALSVTSWPCFKDEAQAPQVSPLPGEGSRDRTQVGGPASGPCPGCAPSQPQVYEQGRALGWKAGGSKGKRQKNFSPTSAQVGVLGSQEVPVPPAPTQPWEPGARGVSALSSASCCSRYHS